MHSTKSDKKKLLFDFYNPDLFHKASEISLKNKIEKLKQNDVKTIFIVSSEAVNKDSYLDLVDFYTNAKFDVKSIHIEGLSKRNLFFVKDAVDDIATAFNNGSCLLISFGDSLIGIILACFYINSDKPVDEALNRVKAIREELIKTNDELEFITDFKKYSDVLKEDEYYAEGTGNAEDDQATYIRNIEKEIKDIITTTKPPALPAHVEAEPQPVVEQKPAESHEKMIPLEQDILTTEKPAPEPEEYKAENIFIEKQAPPEISKPEGTTAISAQISPFSSIRFKLISIMSGVIIIFFSGMILFATHFFKRDNIIRVRQNNLMLSQVIGRKVESDFQSIKDKCSILSSAMSDARQNYNDLLRDDRQMLFLGVASSGNTAAPFKLAGTSVNRALLKETQASESDLEAIHAANKVFNRSFAGDVVVQNVSSAFGVPVMGMSFPYQKSGDGYSSILICYVKLDKMLQIFQTPGITTKIMMINERGDILAHSDSTMIIAGGNFIDLPITKAMFQSKMEDGQQDYKDESGVENLGSFHKIGIGGCGIIATEAKDAALKAVYDQQRQNIYLMIIVLTVVVLIIYFFGKTITTPIINLLGATKMIASGNYNIDIRPASKDEIGQLTSAFILMGKGLEEREKMKDAFGKFVSDEIAEKVLKGEIHLGGEEKKAAVFFSDIRSFTAISEKMQPEEVVGFLNEYMTKMVKCVNETNGFVNKYIGDAIMALWGVPISKGNDTENAVNSALLMRKTLIEYNKGRGSDIKKPVIKIGCGINTGKVLAGQIGSEDRMEYTVIGDAVNLASRIESLNKPFGTDILISEESHELVKDIFAVEKMAPIKVKGKEQPQQIFAVLGRYDDAARPKNVQELRDILEIKGSYTKKDGTDYAEVKYEILEH